MSKIKVSRTLFLIFGAIGPILIGALRIYTHFSQLVSPEVQETLSPVLFINRNKVSYWQTWALMSFMMGSSFVLMGLLNVLTWVRIPKDSFPPMPEIFAMILYLGAVLFVGDQYDQAPQWYGGLGE